MNGFDHERLDVYVAAIDEKARFYRMAKRSATECAATLHVCQRLGLIEAARYQAGRDLLLRIVAMLVLWCAAPTNRARARARARARNEGIPQGLR